ncbi:MAG TPA: cytochrome C oxidase subunit II [Gammaproteobacteria bacterium]|nr:cytochrome C oxidase subunit II [Gammaproteobacteria bacterium]
MSYTSLQPIPQRHWWRLRVGPDEKIWITAAYAWCLVMLVWMVGWFFLGNQNQVGNAYRVTIDGFTAKMDQMVEKYQLKDASGSLMSEGDNDIPVVQVPVGGNVFIAARQFEFPVIPVLELGKTYVFHLSSQDVDHGFSLLPINVNLQLLPGYDYVLRFTPNKTGVYRLTCNEYCGLGHHTMTGKLYVIDTANKIVLDGKGGITGGGA